MTRVKWKAFGEMVYTCRWNTGLTIRELAADLKLSPATLSRADRGKVVSTETFLVICQHFSLDPFLFLR